MMTKIFRSLSLFAFASILASCGPGTISKASVEAGAMAALTAQVGQPSPQITCPSDMKAEVGATQVCSMPLNAGTYDVTVTVTAVSGSTAKYDVVVASSPRA